MLFDQKKITTGVWSNFYLESYTDTVRKRGLDVTINFITYTQNLP